jgi:alkylation response protein AidB-like acyl-CoA dehydrogenase/aminoglycoside phosphotransferase (APT) family kinase protein
MSTTDFSLPSFTRYAREAGLLGQSQSIRSVKKFSGGQSNFTYLIDTGESQLVLRKQPNGNLLSNGAHQVDREALIMTGMRREGRGVVPLPEIYAIESDASIIGTKFFLMEFAPGAIYRDPRLPGLNPTLRDVVYRDMARVLARIHTVDYRNVVPSGGKSTQKITVKSFCERQINIWGQQYEKSIVNNTRVAAMDALQEWLRNNVPASSTPNANNMSILHGDFRVDNIIYNNELGGSAVGDATSVRSVIDWELSSVGVAAADLAYSCLGYYLPPTGFLKAFSMLGNGGLPDGIPTVADYVETYRREVAARGGTVYVPSVDGQEWCYYLCLGLFRIGSIAAGVFARAKQGNASSGREALVFQDAVPLLAETGLQLIKSLSNKKNSVQEVDGDFEDASEFAKDLLRRLRRFVLEEVVPAEEELTDHSLNSSGVWPNRGNRWVQPQAMTRLISLAQSQGLWNLWLTDHMASVLIKRHPQWPWERILPHGHGLSHSDYAYIAMETGRSLFGAQSVNCSAPDTGNMEIIAMFGTNEQQEMWLLPLLLGKIRSCFGMTEPEVASSDPTQLRSSASKATHTANGWVVNGRKWWTTGACDERCAVCIFVATTSVSGPAHQRHSFFLIPMDTPGVTVVRPLTVFGYDDAPQGHAETLFENVLLSSDALLFKEGHGFALAQNRLGPGRLHHCARLVGHSERALLEAVKRGSTRKAFGKALLDLGGNEEKLARCRVALNQAKLTVLTAAKELDLRDKQAIPKLRPQALEALAVCKIAVPRATEECLDFAVQIHGGGGLSSDHTLAAMWAAARTLRLVDGPDEVHLRTLSKMERKKGNVPASGGKQQPGVGRSRL